MGYGPVTKWSRPVPVFVGTVQNPDERAPLPQVNSDERDVQVRVRCDVGAAVQCAVAVITTELPVVASLSVDVGAIGLVARTSSHPELLACWAVIAHALGLALAGAHSLQRGDRRSPAVRCTVPVGSAPGITFLSSTALPFSQPLTLPVRCTVRCGAVLPRHRRSVSEA